MPSSQRASAASVARGQLLDAGLTPRQVDDRVRAGRLHPIHRGVYAVGHRALPSLWREQAALLACGSGSVLSHRSAAVVWALLGPDDGDVHVTRPGSHRRSRPGIRMHQSTAASQVRQGLRVTTLPRTLADLRGPDLERALNEALVNRLASAEQLRDAGPHLRALLAEPPAATRSEAERRLLAVLARAGLPRPRTNHRVAGFEVDAHWPEHRLVVEVDGYAAHGSRRAFEHDRARDAALSAAGHTVLRFTWRQLTERPEQVAVRLAALLSPPPASLPATPRPARARRS